MKVVALALVLLAVGTHAASLQADAPAVPSELAHMRAALDVYLNQIKDAFKKSVDQLNDAEYKDLKTSLTEHIDYMYNQLKAFQSSVSPVTDSVFNTIMEATAGVRAAIEADIEALKTELEPKRIALQTVIDRHIEDYRAQMEPIIKEYTEKHNADMEALKVKLQPILTELKKKIEANVEETKSALTPMIESVRNKVTQRLEELKGIVSPYVEEYKDQLQKSFDQIRNITPDDITSLWGTIQPLTEEIKAKLVAIFEAISTTVTKN